MPRSFLKWLLALTLLGGACQRSEEAKMAAEPMRESAQRPMEQAPSRPGKVGLLSAVSGAPMNPGTYVIRSAFLRVRVDDLAAYEQAATALTLSVGGYVASQSALNTGSRLQANLVLRVPAAKLDGVLGGLGDMAAFVEQRDVSSEDVTAQYVDVEARLTSRREVERQYLALLKRARSVQDMVAIQEKLGQVREEIESAEAVRKSLANQIDYATVNLNVFQELDTAFFAAGDWSKALGRAFKEGVSALFGFVLWLVRLWPFALVALVLGLWFRARRRRSA